MKWPKALMYPPLAKQGKATEAYAALMIEDSFYGEGKCTTSLQASSRQGFCNGIKRNYQTFVEFARECWRSLKEIDYDFVKLSQLLLHVTEDFKKR